ncbi:MAG: hypothetical protein ACI8SA_000608 [Dokdonia sp.]|jgi:hypothetical protein
MILLTVCFFIQKMFTLTKYYKTIQFLFLLVFCTSIHAQTWEKSNSTKKSEQYPCLIKHQNKILLTFHIPNTDSKIEIHTIDSIGNEVNKDEILPTSNFEYTYISKSVLVHDDLYFMGTSININNNVESLTFIKYNLDTKTSTQINYPKNDTTDRFFDYSIINNALFVSGRAAITNQTFNYAFIKEFDLNGNLVNENYFPNYFFSTGYLWGSNPNKFSARTLNHFDFRFDRNGFIPKDTIITSINSSTTAGVVNSNYNKSTHYLSGRYADTIPGTRFWCETLKITNDSVLSNNYRFGKPYKQNRMHGLIPLAQVDSNIIYLIGTTATKIDLQISPDPAEIALFKTNQNGDTLFMKYYKGEVKYIANSIIATPDGGALIASSKYDWNSPYPDQWDIHLLKVDSLGNYTPLGEEEIIEPNKSIAVYPNPAQQFITISGVSSFPSQFTVFDITGRELHTETLHSPTQKIDVSKLPKGAVIYIVTSSKNSYSGRLVLN